MLALRLRTLLPPPITVATTSSTLRTLYYSTSTHLSMPIHPPTSRPTDWKSAAPSPPAGSTTFAAQSTLPKLPVLPLVPTLERLKDTLVPIAHSQAELADAQRKIDEFAAGIGPELQRRLEVHAQYKPHWLEQWWDDGAYLSYRDSVCRSLLPGVLIAHRRHQPMINVSYYCSFIVESVLFLPF
jgi:Choline/Carnitine o-acyltransferase